MQMKYQKTMGVLLLLFGLIMAIVFKKLPIYHYIKGDLIIFLPLLPMVCGFLMVIGKNK